MIIKGPFKFVLTNVQNKPGEWSSTLCTISRKHPEISDSHYEYVGEFTYNYDMGYLKNILQVFQLENHWFLLYSTDYQKLMVASLEHGFRHLHSTNDGFCPVETAIPFYISREIQDDGLYETYEWDAQHFIDHKLEYKVEHANFGFLSGCTWGDDSSYKLRYLDFSKLVVEGTFESNEAFGYFELPDGPLRQHIDLSWLLKNGGGLHLSERRYFPLLGGGFDTSISK